MSFKPSDLVHGLPGHPLHPPLTDVTIGAYTFATVSAIAGKAGSPRMGSRTHGGLRSWSG